MEIQDYHFDDPAVRFEVTGEVHGNVFQFQTRNYFRLMVHVFGASGRRIKTVEVGFTRAEFESTITGVTSVQQAKEALENAILTRFNLTKIVPEQPA